MALDASDSTVERQSQVSMLLTVSRLVEGMSDGFSPTEDTVTQAEAEALQATALQPRAAREGREQVRAKRFASHRAYLQVRQEIERIRKTTKRTAGTRSSSRWRALCFHNSSPEASSTLSTVLRDVSRGKCNPLGLLIEALLKRSSRLGQCFA